MCLHTPAQKASRSHCHPRKQQDKFKAGVVVIWYNELIILKRCDGSYGKAEDLGLNRPWFNSS